MHKSDHYLPRSKIHSVRVGVGLLYLCVIKYLHFGGQKDEVFNCFTHRNTLLRCVCFQGAVCRCFNANVYIPLLYRLLRCLRCLVFAHLFCFACNIRPLCAIAHIIGQKKMHDVCRALVYLRLEIAEIAGFGKLSVFGKSCNFPRLNPCTWCACTFQAQRIETPTNTSEAKRKKYKSSLAPVSRL